MSSRSSLSLVEPTPDSRVAGALGRVAIAAGLTLWQRSIRDIKGRRSLQRTP
jgi:hypothetical protein